MTSMYRLENTPLLSGLTIGHVETVILDLPIRRPHEFAHQTMNRQSHVLVRIRSDDGLEGIGEGVTAGGPWWGGESVETIKAMVDTYLTPVLIGENPSRINYLLEHIERAASGNACAKAAVEMALYDMVGKTLGVPVYELLGGLYRDSLPGTVGSRRGRHQ